jgi:hypothetical protein
VNILHSVEETFSAKNCFITFFFFKLCIILIFFLFLFFRSLFKHFWIYIFSIFLLLLFNII